MLISLPSQANTTRHDHAADNMADVSTTSPAPLTPPPPKRRKSQAASAAPKLGVHDDDKSHNPGKWAIVAVRSGIQSNRLRLVNLRQHVPALSPCVCGKNLLKACTSWTPLNVITLQEEVKDGRKEDTLLLHDGLNGISWAAEWDSKEEMRLVVTCLGDIISSSENKSGRSTGVKRISIQPVDVEHVRDDEVCEGSDTSKGDDFLTMSLETAGESL